MLITPILSAFSASLLHRYQTQLFIVLQGVQKFHTKKIFKMSMG